MTRMELAIVGIAIVASIVHAQSPRFIAVSNELSMIGGSTTFDGLPELPQKSPALLHAWVLSHVMYSTRRSPAANVVALFENVIVRSVLPLDPGTVNCPVPRLVPLPPLYL